MSTVLDMGVAWGEGVADGTREDAGVGQPREASGLRPGARVAAVDIAAFYGDV